MSTEHLEWRYAVKKFDPSKKISLSEIQHLCETLRLSPSSFGLQPWRFLIIENLELRKKLQPFCWNQPQVTEASHLVVLCSLTHMDETYVKNYVHDIAKTREVSVESLAGYGQMMSGFIKKLSPDALKEWMKNQIYLALGMLLCECAHRKIDSCPMEGFEPDKVDAVLDLPSKNLRAVVLCPIGYRAGDDKHAQFKKVRFPGQQIITSH